MDTNKISIESAIKELHFSDSPKAFALSYIELLANQEEGLRIYFDGNIRGTEVLYEPEPTYTYPAGNEEPEIDKVLIANGDSAEIPGPKWLKSLNVLNKEGVYLLATSRFIIDGTEYFCCDETGMYLENKLINLDSVYCISAEVEKLRSNLSMNRLNSSKPQGNEPGVRKALALLAREKAEASAKFKTGDKVNARAMKDHLIALAKTHLISDSGLRKIDDKLNQSLQEYDLKEIKS